MVGIGTVLADNPRLTVRLVEGRSPRRVVVDSTLRIPLDAAVLGDAAADTIIATTGAAAPERVGRLRARGATVVTAAATPAGRVDLADLLARLVDQGICSLMLEGGQGLITSVLGQRLADRLIICIAPKIVGAGIEAVGDLDVARLAQALTFRRSRFYRLGPDLIFDGVLALGRASPPAPLHRRWRGGTRLPSPSPMERGRG
jgi:5-amino-6-(5-phosphoribosylamino)uracil reductase/diaminohydroxyphosphoribosylaminopyrimidine deaminase/5-amino-6-(5-phosphoribosylamino)uracil reductase